MNILGLVFSLLLIFLYGFYTSWDKHLSSHCLRKTYTAHNQAYRNILNQFESKYYENLGRLTTPAENKELKGKKEKVEEEGEKEEEKEKEVENRINRECARINIWPLIHEGRENHPVLYDLAAKLIRTFYSPLQNEKRFEIRFLNLLLASAKTALQEETPFALEKIVLPDPGMQKIYYKMLKGTKQWDLGKKVGYPPLLDYFKAAPSQEKICLFHANAEMLSALFNEKIGKKLHSEIHRQDGPPPSIELVTRLSFEAYQIGLDPDLLAMLEYGKPYHQENKKIFVATKGNCSLRKSLFIKER